MSQEDVDLLAAADRYFIRSSLWPAIVYTGLLLIVGTAGNVLVILVYRRHFRRSVTRMFIYALAVLDLGNCLITMPAELTILSQFTSFSSPVWCKVSRYLTYTFHGTSSLILIVIALDRYFKVCRPMKTNIITLPRAKVICLVSFTFAALVSIPALVIYGELQLSIHVTENSFSILPFTNTINISSPNSSFFTPQVSPAPATNLLRSSLASVSTASLPSTNTSDWSDRYIVGKFCLLNAKNINSTTSLLFYVSMFASYLVLVILVFFFYGNVARTLFLMNTKHERMFSFKSYQNHTPSSNSMAAERSLNVEISNKAVLDLSSADPKIMEGINMVYSGESRSLKKCPADEQAETFGKNLDGLNVDNTLHRENEVEGGHMTTEEQKVKSQQSMPHQDNLTDNSRNQCQAIQVNKTQSPSSNLTDSQKNNEHNRTQSACIVSTDKMKNKIQFKKDTCLVDVRRPQSERKENISTYSKIPKIKIKKVTREKRNSSDNKTHTDNEEDKCSVDSSEYEQQYRALSSNSLLQRRIKSAESINCIKRLQILQVPESRATRGPKFPDLVTDSSSVTSRLRRSTREHRAELGKITTSCVNLNYVTENPNSSVTQEKILTLTRTLHSGKKNVCVLPLRGLTTKAASQPLTNKVLTREDLSESSRQAECSVHQKEFSKSDSCIEVDPNPDNVKSTKKSLFKSTPMLDNSPCQDSEITLRSRTPDIINYHKLHPLDTEKYLNHFPSVQKTQRTEVVSTVDILAEQHKRGSLHPFRMSRMLFVISLVFVMSYAPFFIIVLARWSQEFSLSLSDLDLGVMSIFIRSSLISNGVNPIVYGFLSTHFRRESAVLLRRIFKRH